MVESVALTVLGELGFDTSGYPIPYLTSWSADDSQLEAIERCASVVDQPSKRMEDAIGRPPEDDEARMGS